MTLTERVKKLFGTKSHRNSSSGRHNQNEGNKTHSRATKHDRPVMAHQGQQRPVSAPIQSPASAYSSPIKRPTSSKENLRADQTVVPRQQAPTSRPLVVPALSPIQDTSAPSTLSTEYKTNNSSTKPGSDSRHSEQLKPDSKLQHESLALSGYNTKQTEDTCVDTSHTQDVRRGVVEDKQAADDESWVANSLISKTCNQGRCYIESLTSNSTIPTDFKTTEATTQIRTVKHAPVTKLTTGHTYEHRLQRDVLHERHLYEREHVLQPIREVVQEASRASEHRLPLLQHVHEHSIDTDTASKNHRVTAQLDTLKTATDTRLLDRHTYVEDNPTIREVVIRHVTKEIHPVIEKFITVPFVISKKQAVKEIHKDVVRHHSVLIAEPITLEEWTALIEETKNTVDTVSDSNESFF